MGIRPAALWLVPLVLAAEGIPPKPAPSAYPASAKADGITIGASYLYRSVPAGRGSVFVKGYLVVEVAVFGPKGKRLDISSGHFTLRVNHSKRTLAPEAPQLVISQERYGRKPELDIGLGSGAIILGGPPLGPRFPGDARRRPPPGGRPRIETQSAPVGPARNDPAALMKRTALPVGNQLLPIAGYLYYPYRKKTKSIKHLELVYQGPAGSAVLRLK